MNKAFENILDRLDTKKLYFQKFYETEGKTEDDENINKATQLAFDGAKSIVKEVAEEYNGGWIQTKTRPMTEEEKEYYSEFLVECNGFIYECHLPDDGQEVLITSKYGSVDKTTFYTDCGNYFENYEDYDEVIAWQPLPEPYQSKGE